MIETKEVGQSYPRHEALHKALGTARYTDDLAFPGMVHGMILRSPYPHARVLAIDTSDALRSEGVLGILTPWDVVQTAYNCSGNPPSDLIFPDETILTDHPRCVGDRICAVAAVTAAQCREAIDKLRVKYEVLPAVTGIKAALEKNAPLVQEERSPGGNVMKTLTFSQGDVEQGFSEADHVFEETFYTQPISHVALELTGCVCDAAPDGKITVWSPSQTPYQERRILSELFERNESDVRIVKPVTGGGFGARQQLHSQPVGILLSRLVKRPVKLMNTREEDICATATRHETSCTIKLGVMKDGKLVAAHIRNYLNGGPYTTHTPTVSAAAGRKFQYRIPHYRYEGISVYTNAPTAGAMRGYGNLQVVAGREVLLSRVARTLGLDPVSFRLQNHVATGERFPAADYDILSCGIEECVAAAERIRADIDRVHLLRDTDERREAWGEAFCCHSTGPSNKDGMSSAIVTANDDGSVCLSIGSADIGQGSETVMCQIAAESLGVDYPAVSVRAADTAVNPYDTGTFASGQTYVCGNAVALACRDLSARLAAALAGYHDLPQDSVSVLDGVYRVGCPDRELRLTFREAVRLLAFGMKGLVLIGSASYKAKASPPPFAVCYARAVYYKKTNAIEITDVIEVADVGTAINPESVRGQLEGGVGMGVGFALMEDIEHNRTARKTVCADLLGYRAPLTVDMPRIHVDIARSSYEPSGPLGAKSVGELAAVPVAPAIVNAVAAASGKDTNSLPLSRFYSVGRTRLSNFAQEEAQRHEEPV